ncbi:MAG: sulfate adenylyltransferase subunit 2 [Crocinitomicaceae bacterium]|jgi:sulfate adenylyltransferase subunit 2|nr:sulfate adenylyltransferase subunit 2 [Crocinitomicaceae bacterium]MDG1657993.1 sulfate adenylyltransferase subunit 2 [Crocinitomicaceae bacterium]|tara:strand:- start:786 stop:1682 length:897 start_codon:yes stop_codon:yes gene_type:complete
MTNKHLYKLENESIYILREVAAQFKKPVLLFSGGKDSIVMARLAQKAFYPSKIPFSFMHIDTGHNFPETIAFRDEIVKKLDVNLIVRYVQDSIDENKVQEEAGKYASRNALQTVTLLDAIEEFGFDVCIGGARRDEEKSRAKERIFSVRDDFGQWDYKNQRPEPFQMLNGKIQFGENVRAFPISNWTEEDIWTYILQENLDLPTVYFAHQRKLVKRDGALIAHSDFLNIVESDEIEEQSVRFRTVGDMTCTAAFLSTADTVEKVLKENMASKHSERGARIDDKRSESALEDRKKGGYF